MTFLGRIEHRLPDGSTNLYLTHAVILAAGLDGIDTDAGETCAVCTIMTSIDLF